MWYLSTVGEGREVGVVALLYALGIQAKGFAQISVAKVLVAKFSELVYTQSVNVDLLRSLGHLCTFLRQSSAEAKALNSTGHRLCRCCSHGGMYGWARAVLPAEATASTLAGPCTWTCYLWRAQRCAPAGYSRCGHHTHWAASDAEGVRRQEGERQGHSTYSDVFLVDQVINGSQRVGVPLRATSDPQGPAPDQIRGRSDTRVASRDNAIENSRILHEHAWKGESERWRMPIVSSSDHTHRLGTLCRADYVTACT
eukprot:scaffold6247_cov416-Prasinococcus_capsulatus_cf.AAC.4